MNNSPQMNYNIEDTGALMTRAKGGGRTKRIIIIAAAVIAVLAIALVGWKMLGDKRYNEQIEIAEKEFVEGNYEQAEAEYLKAVEMKKRKPKAREGLAYTYAIQGKYDKAIEEYNKLYDDFKEKKHSDAAEGLENGKTLPIDPDLAPAQGKWRKLSKEQMPYYDSLENFLLCVYANYFCGHPGEAFDSNKPDGFPALSVFMTGFGSDGYAMPLEDYDNYRNGKEYSLLAEGEFVDGDDPKKWRRKSESLFFDLYKVYDVDEVDQVMRDIFNLSDEYIEAMVEEEAKGKKIYKQDGKYHCVSILPVGVENLAAEISGIWTDGNKYCIEHDDGVALSDGLIMHSNKINRNEANETYYTILEPKEIDGKHYWSLYYNGTEMPDEIKDIAKEEPAPEPKEEPKPEPKEEPKPNPARTLVEPSNTAGGGMHGYVSADGDGLNLRYGPGTDYDTIRVLPDGTEGVERGWNDAGDWIFIETGGVRGWVKSEFFSMVGGKEKPVIYLYPTKTTDVSVKVSLTDGYFTKTIPAANNGAWNVTARPNGKITDKASGKTYDYLFWESSDNTEYDWSKGYVVAGIEAKGFLKKILPEMGLNKKESEEFTEYWLPRLQKNRYNLVTFQTKCYTDVAKLNVNPKPDSMLRVFMAFKEISKPIPIKKPTIVPFERKGFTVVEWGGAEVK